MAADAAGARQIEVLKPRLSALSGELHYAWARTDQAELNKWLAETGADFANVFGRRVGNFLELIGFLGEKTFNEISELWAAYALFNLDGHLQARCSALGTSITALYDQAVTDVSALGSALKTKPAEVAPKLLSALVTSLLVSGGPDGNGGAPDLDLAFGIEAHRSIFTHSILMGSALETAFLSLLRLVRLLHSRLPADHHRGWDAVADYAEQVASGAIAGAGIGMAYHLIIDGLVQPGTLQDIPFSMPQQAHDAITTAGGVMEAQDLAHKNNGHCIQRTPIALGHAERTDAEEKELHRAYLHESTEIGPLVAALLPQDCVPVIERHGAWLTALANGKLRPLSLAQKQFLRVATWEVEPQTLHEHSWYAYSLARIALLLTFRPSIRNSIRRWWAKEMAEAERRRVQSGKN